MAEKINIYYGVNGEWRPLEAKSVESLPNATTNDEGKFLRVVDGAPAWVTVANAEEASF